MAYHKPGAIEANLGSLFSDDENKGLPGLNSFEEFSKIDKKQHLRSTLQSFAQVRL